MSAMRIVIGGLARNSSTLIIQLPRHVEWPDVRDVLSIVGVRYYMTDTCAMIVSFRQDADARDIAAQCLHVIAAHVGVSVSELAVDIKDVMVRNHDELATDIELRALCASAPGYVSRKAVAARGTGPAYWLA